MNATADNSYANCPNCKWAGKLRKDGTMRKHRESVDMGRFTMSGGLPQQTHGDICKGSGEKPWETGLPEGYELPEKNEHGGWKRGGESAAPKQAPGPSLDDYAKASRIIQSLIPGVRR
ncbi:MAG TPA: hypothetical protein VI172_01670 [Candidatus Dormibacteraeota bacterium]